MASNWRTRYAFWSAAHGTPTLSTKQAHSQTAATRDQIDARPKGRIAGSIPATLTKTESLFAITALEDTSVFEYDFHEFKKLVSKHRDIAEFYIRYMEQHWIIEKEPDEISLRYDAAKIRYEEVFGQISWP